MKLQPDSNQASYSISAQGQGFVEVNHVRYLQGICLGTDAAPEPWGCAGFSKVTEDDFTRLVELKPEIVIIGTGSQQCFPHPSLLQPLMSRGIGFEVMNTAAACRTYNILAGEGRRVVAGLIISPRNVDTPGNL